MGTRKVVKVYMLELINFVIGLGGEHARVFEEATDQEIAAFIAEIPEVELLVA